MSVTTNLKYAKYKAFYNYQCNILSILLLLASDSGNKENITV